MKNLFLLLFTLISTVVISQTSVNWTSVEDAQAEAEKSDKPILMDIYAEWCRPCKMLSKSFEDEKVAEFVNDNFIPVKFNAEHSESVTFNGKVYKNPNFDANKRGRNAAHELTKTLGTKGYPTVYILKNENLEVSEKLPGYKPADKLLESLKSVKVL